MTIYREAILAEAGEGGGPTIIIDIIKSSAC